MTDPTPDSSSIVQLLDDWIQACCWESHKSQLEWFKQKVDEISAGAKPLVFFTAFSMVARKLPGKSLGLSPEQLAQAREIRKNWRPDTYDCREAARIRFCLSIPEQNAEKFGQTMDELFRTADVNEAVALGKALPLLPFPEKHYERARLCCRSNMKSLFESVAHYNPYPSEQFEDQSWNQLVLKALFVGSSLDKIIGIDERANASLTPMLLDYARERWKASRPVSPELWRCTGRFMDESHVDLLENLLQKQNRAEKTAAVLTLKSSRLPQKEELLKRYAGTVREVEKMNAGWDGIIDEV